jgi:hypothetical protein
METKTEKEKQRLNDKVVLIASSFGVKDFNKSFEKWESYKAEKFKTAFENNAEEIKSHVEGLSENIDNAINNDYKNFEQVERIFNKGITPRALREFKTFINLLVMKINGEFVKWLDIAKNPNEQRAFNIKLYLSNYEQINAEMEKAFKEYAFNRIEQEEEKEQEQKQEQEGLTQ